MSAVFILIIADSALSFVTGRDFFMEIHITAKVALVVIALTHDAGKVISWLTKNAK